MKLYDQILMCLQNLLRRKSRTLLTVSGVIIGTCAIVVMVSLGIGMQQSQDAMLAQMGDLTIIDIYFYNSGATAGNGQEQVKLNDEALKKILALPHVEVATPYMSPSVWNAFTLCGGNGNRYQMDMYNIVGVYPEALEKLGYTLKDGDFLPDITHKDTAVMLLGEYTAYDFRDVKKKRNNYVRYWMNPEDPPDPFVDVLSDKMVLRINSQDSNGKSVDVKVKVSGVLVQDQSKGYETGYGVYMSIDQLNQLTAQYYKLNKIKTTNQQDSTTYTNAKVKVTDMKYVEEVEEAIHDLGFPDTNSMESVRKPMQEQVQQQQMTLGGLGAISLLVAALGITNTMVMSIYERTREIGVMKVLGCMVNNIRSVFLMEAGIIGFFGGVIGVGISYGISALINVFGFSFGGNNNYSYYYDMAGPMDTSVIPLWLVFAALVFSTCIGLISGYGPANRAVKISALEAIKNE